MTGLRASTPADPADHPLRAALARGDRLQAESAPALRHLLAAVDRSLIADDVVAQVRGLLFDLARQLVDARSRATPTTTMYEAMANRLYADPDLRSHCQALALEWRLVQMLEAEIALDPVLSPQLQDWVGMGEGGIGSLAMAALAAQARFAQEQRRMALPLAELPAELFHLALETVSDANSDGESEAASRANARLRAGYDESASRLALLNRLVREDMASADKMLAVEQAGVAVWLSLLAARSHESRDRIACAVADPNLGRLLLTLRAAGMAPADAERQALRVQPEANLPRGLGDIGTREAAQWLAEARG